MVEVQLNLFAVDQIDHHGFTNESLVTVVAADVGKCHWDHFATHKRVLIELMKEDDGIGETTTISLSPLRALALVRRLIDVVDGLGLDDLPPINSRALRLYVDALYGADIDSDIREYLAKAEDLGITIEASGKLLADILPPSIR